MRLNVKWCKVKGERVAARRSWLLALGAGLYFSPMISYGQCAMCRAAIESEGNVAKAEAVNDGIVYLMVIPYLLVGGIGYLIYRMRKEKVI